MQYTIFLYLRYKLRYICLYTNTVQKRIYIDWIHNVVFIWVVIHIGRWDWFLSNIKLEEMSMIICFSLFIYLLIFFFCCFFSYSINNMAHKHMHTHLVAVVSFRICLLTKAYITQERNNICYRMVLSFKLQFIGCNKNRYFQTKVCRCTFWGKIFFIQCIFIQFMIQ